MNKQNLHTEIIALCDYASVSREGKLSINGIFDEFRPVNLPAAMARIFFVASLVGSPDTSYSLNLKVEKDDNKELQGFPNLNIDVRTSLSGRNNIVLELVGLNFQHEGKYSFKIYNKKEEVGSTTLTVFRTVPNVTKDNKPN